MKNTTKNTWFEETFLPSQEARMTNPKYPNQVILSEKQRYICEKYMKEKLCVGINGKDFYIYTYDIGTKHYTMHFAGKYTFLHMEDDAKLIWFVGTIRGDETVVTFKTEQELQDWIDEYVDEDTGIIKGREDLGRKWTTGRRHVA